MTQSAQARKGSARLADILPATGWLVALLAPLVLIKAVQLFYAPPTPDEAYYWLWGRHLDWSYYDHPPMVAWLQAVSADLFGWSLFSLRLQTLLTFAGDLWILWYWARRLAGPELARRAFLAGMVTWLSAPVLMRFQSLAQPDHLLIFFGMATAHFWALFVVSLEKRARAWRFFYLGCVTLGLAGLSKYNAVFIGLGFAAWVFASPKGRPLLASPHLWLGAGLAVAMQAPVIGWNVAHDWPSFQYNLENRIGQTMHAGFAGSLFSFLLWSVIMVSPVLAVGLVRFVAGAVATPFGPIGRWVFLASTLTFVALCASNTILHYWNLAAYLFILPVAVFFIGSRLEFSLHAFYGIVMALYVVVFHVVYPSYKLAGNDLRDNDITLGLPEIAAIMAEEESRLGADVVMTTDYRTASLLAFAMRRDDIAKIGPRNDQFDFWFPQAALKGKDALVMVDDELPETDLLAQVFARVTPVREFTIERFGFPMHTYRLLLAEDYSGKGQH